MSNLSASRLIVEPSETSLSACSNFTTFYGCRSAEEGRGDTNARFASEVIKLNEMRKVMIFIMFVGVTLLSSFSTVYAAYGLWYTSATVKCDFAPDSNVIARVKVYLLKRQSSLLPYPGYFELLCSYANSDTEVGITTNKPTGWRVEWIFLVDGYSSCPGSKLGSSFPATLELKCSTYNATVVAIAAPTH